MPVINALGTVSDLCTRKDWIEVADPEIYYEGQGLAVWAWPVEICRGTMTVMAVSKHHHRIYVDSIPVATVIGDLLALG